MRAPILAGETTACPVELVIALSNPGSCGGEIDGGGQDIIWIVVAPVDGGVSVPIVIGDVCGACESYAI